MGKVLVIGEICEDIIIHEPFSVPVLGTDMWSRDIIAVPGGSAYYVSTVLTHLGRKTSLWATVGGDATGNALINKMESAGVDCSLVQRLPKEKTTRSVVSYGESTGKEFISCSPILPVKVPSASDLHDVEAVVVAGYLLFPELWVDQVIGLFEQCDKSDIPVYVDSQSLPVDVDVFSLARLTEALPHFNTLFLSKRDVEQMAGGSEADDVENSILPYGVKNIIYKRGKTGSYLINSQGTVSISTIDAKVYDSIGSGDIFCGAYVHAALNGWDSIDCVRFANVFAALSIGEYEDFKKYPEKKEVKSVLENL